MVAEWILGLENVPWPVVKRAANGFREQPKGDRSKGTGIKHFTANKLKLHDQETYIDNNPCVLIIPIRTLDQVKNWNGEGYEAVVAVGDWERHHIKYICRRVGLIELGDEATPEEIRLCTDLLAQVVRGMAHRVLDRRQNPTKLGELPPQVRDFDDSRLTINFSDMAPTVTVPVKQEGDLRVRKIRFCHQNEFPRENDNHRHIAPDPLLLAAKAACVWSTRQGERLVAGGEIEDDNFSEGDYIAAEAYIAAQEANEASLRPRSREDLARGLHQLNGYQASVLGS
jgi:hypothetical protein